MAKRSRRRDSKWYREMIAGLHTGLHCIPLLPDPRGPGWLLAGTCVDCGKATTRRRDGGQPHCRGTLGEFAIKPQP